MEQTFVLLCISISLKRFVPRNHNKEIILKSFYSKNYDSLQFQVRWSNNFRRCLSSIFAIWICFYASVLFHYHLHPRCLPVFYHLHLQSKQLRYSSRWRWNWWKPNHCTRQWSNSYISSSKGSSNFYMIRRNILSKTYSVWIISKHI